MTRGRSILGLHPASIPSLYRNCGRRAGASSACHACQALLSIATTHKAEARQGPTPDWLPGTPCETRYAESAGTTEVLGESAQGRPIVAHRFAGGSSIWVFLAGFHGGHESHTVDLAEALISHLGSHPRTAPHEVSLWIVPVVNPDALARQRGKRRSGERQRRRLEPQFPGLVGGGVALGRMQG